MKAEEVFNTYLSYNKWLKELQEHEKDLILYMMKEYSRLMCDKQKEICYSNIKILRGDWYDQGDKLGEPYLDEDKFLNAPYPDELQGNN